MNKLPKLNEKNPKTKTPNPTQTNQTNQPNKNPKHFSEWNKNENNLLEPMECNSSQSGSLQVKMPTLKPKAKQTNKIRSGKMAHRVQTTEI